MIADVITERGRPVRRSAGVLARMGGRWTVNRESRQVADEVRSHFSQETFDTVIPRNVALSEAPSFGVPVIMHDGSSVGAARYWALADEVLNNGGH